MIFTLVVLSIIVIVCSLFCPKKVNHTVYTANNIGFYDGLYDELDNPYYRYSQPELYQAYEDGFNRGKKVKSEL